MKNYQNLKAYRDNTEHAADQQFSGYKIVQLLLAGALEKIALTKGFMRTEGWVNLQYKGEHISNVITILEALQASLDLEKGGELAQNLDYLYAYMQHKLLEANLENQEAILDEVIHLLTEIKTGWDAINPEQQKP